MGNFSIIGTCVTIGGKGKGKGIQGAPVIGDNVYLATGCKVIGEVTIGSNVVVGANSVVTKDVPDVSVNSLHLDKLPQLL
ncbi:hypothetical protein BJAS_P1582 [Bathymodiolus japonicus methanotrophic gill symbiont]|uniref:hypothetical protein n=1 Tax=Bathymodiolus japonicus methanotrophic gill symbiont TaxID=113269 RepID=UPI001B765399|nr:hypothetical protein [Bathymodiolus japonicus methanotrophic gill symbiont]GFO71823.1 hypothetical protein BJAS_P1582 [Bathymodiolus japonicus methanotrophic gill symbiont]